MAKYIIDIPDENESDYIAETPFGKRLFFPLRITDVAYSIPTHLHVEEYIDVNREEIEDEVWDFVKIAFWNMTQEDIDQCYDGWFPDSYEEAKAQYAEWKQEKEGIRIGDEVEYPPNKAKGIVIQCHVPDVHAEVDKYAVFTGTSVEYLLKEWLTKTGRIFPEMVELLERMKAEWNIELN